MATLTPALRMAGTTAMAILDPATEMAMATETQASTTNSIVSETKSLNKSGQTYYDLFYHLLFHLFTARVNRTSDFLDRFHHVVIFNSIACQRLIGS